MRRYLLVFLTALGLCCLWPFAAAATTKESSHRPLCSEGSPTCTETVDSIGEYGNYTGHDEPALLFYSNRAGAGNSNLYHLTLPSDPKQLPSRTLLAG